MPACWAARRHGPGAAISIRVAHRIPAGDRVLHPQGVLSSVLFFIHVKEFGVQERRVIRGLIRVPGAGIDHGNVPIETPGRSVEPLAVAGLLALVAPTHEMGEVVEGLQPSKLRPHGMEGVQLR